MIDLPKQQTFELGEMKWRILTRPQQSPSCRLVEDENKKTVRFQHFVNGVSAFSSGTCQNKQGPLVRRFSDPPCSYCCRPTVCFIEA